MAFTYSINFNATNNRLSSTEKCLIDRINMNIEHNFQGLQAKYDCLSYAKNKAYTDGIRLATGSRNYCTLNIQEDGKPTTLNIEKDVEKIKEFALFVISEIKQGKFSETIDKKNSQITRRGCSLEIEQEEQEETNHNVDMKKVNKIVELMNNCIYVFKKCHVIKTKEDFLIEDMEVGKNYLYGKQIESPRFINLFLPRFMKFTDLIMSKKIKTEYREMLVDYYNQINALAH